MEEFGRARIDWLKQFLDLQNGIPSHDTFNRVFSIIDPKEFEDRFAVWVQTISGKLSRHIAIDGKVVSGSGNRRNKKEPLWIVSAWASDLDLVLAHTSVENKSNEITAIPNLLETLYVNGCVISIDAMGCQKDIARDIIDKGAAYEGFVARD